MGQDDGQRMNERQEAGEGRLKNESEGEHPHGFESVHEKAGSRGENNQREQTTQQQRGYREAGIGSVVYADG